MDQVRRKTVTLDGADFVISNLTFKQATELADAEKELPDKDVTAYRDFRLKVVAESLSRAGQSVTAEALQEILDFASLDLLFREILIFCGLRSQGGASGESKA